MTQPNSESQPTRVTVGQGGRASQTWGGFAGKPAMPNATQPKPKMTDEELRLECVRLAVQSKVLPGQIIETASRMLNFVKSGSTS